MWLLLCHSRKEQYVKVRLAGVYMAKKQELTGFAGPQHLPERPLKPSAAIDRPQVLPKVLHQHRPQLALTCPPVRGREKLQSQVLNPCDATKHPLIVYRLMCRQALYYALTCLPA